MKKLSIVAVILTTVMVASCGNGTPKADLKSDIDTLSYTLGMANSEGLRGYIINRLGVDSAYIDEFLKGLNDGVNASDDKKKTAYFAGIQIGQQVQQIFKGVNMEVYGEDSTQTISLRNFLAGFISGGLEINPLMPMDSAKILANQKMSEVKAAQLEEKYGEWRAQNEAYMAKLEGGDGINKLSEGVYYRVIEEGTGDVPEATDRVEVNYEGKLIDGTIFDSSYAKGTSVTFHCQQVIPGWTEVLMHMPVGSKWEVWICSDKAYGMRQAGDVKPFSALNFTMELLNIVK